MRVFVTGATGFIGMAVTRELLAAGHRVIGLTRSDDGARSLSDAGATPHRGSLEDLESLRSGAASADGVIHLAFIHEFTDVRLSTRLGVMARGLAGKGVVSSFMGVMIGTDAAAIETLGSALAGTGKPFVVTVGTMGLSMGRPSSETDKPDAESPGAARSIPSEKAALALAAQGVRTSVVRLPPSVHGDGDHGFIPRLAGIARKKGVSAYVGDGSNRWPAVHRLDAARLYRIALETGSAGGIYHGVADEGVPFRAIAETIGRHLNVPVMSRSPDEAARHFGWLAPFVAADNPVTSEMTRQQLDWQPIETGLMQDIGRAAYFGNREHTP